MVDSIVSYIKNIPIDFTYIFLVQCCIVARIHIQKMETSFCCCKIQENQLKLEVYKMISKKPSNNPIVQL